jgi:hypothetical protein
MLVKEGRERKWLLFVFKVWCRWIGTYADRFVRGIMGVMFCVSVCQIPKNEEDLREGGYVGLLRNTGLLRQRL